MNSLAGQEWPITDPADLLDLLDDARMLIEFNQFDQAIRRYRTLLDQPATAEAPAAHAEILGNLGALLLNLAPADGEALMLNDAIDLFHTARALRIAGRRTLAMAIADTNLALAYCRRFKCAGDHADLLAAHLTLDGAQAIMLASGDNTILDWLNAVRDLVVETAERRRKPQ